MCNKPGNKYAIVFPDPVYAMPIKSWPDIIIGNTFNLSKFIPDA